MGRYLRLLGVAAISCAVFSGCDSEPSVLRLPTGASPPPPPTQPSPQPSPPPVAPGQGTIALREVSPAAGATLAVQSNCPSGQVTRICTDMWRGTFDVLVDREMPTAVLTVRFYNGQTKCGYGAGTLDIVPAGERVSFSVTRIVLSDEFGTFATPCPLPATTNRMEAELWTDSGRWSNTLKQEFATAYTFSER